MVPIVEMFNHECSDVYYDFDYLENNISRPAVDNIIFRVLKGLESLKKEILKRFMMIQLQKRVITHK